MPAYYLDSSALVKRYVTETGSAWVHALCADAANALFISELALMEVGSAYARRCHRGEITDEQRRNYLDVFIYDCTETYHLIAAGRSLIERGLDLTQRRYLRAYDAMQLASALAANAALTLAGLPALIFVSADDGLLHAANAEGLQTENPNVPIT